MVNRFWIILVLIVCVFIVFFLAPFGEEEARQTADEKLPAAAVSVNQ